jgi:hypothetical protein
VAVLRDGQLIERFPTAGVNGQGLAAKYSQCIK